MRPESIFSGMPHIDAWNPAMDFINKMEKPPSTIVVRTQSQSQENYETNVHILKCIVIPVLYCVRQGNASRSRIEANLDGNANPGNFIAF